MTLESTSASPSSAISDGAFSIGLSAEKASMWRNSEIGLCSKATPAPSIATATRRT